jgi:hypothetical protein
VSKPVKMIQSGLSGMNPETYLKETFTKIAEGHPISRLDELMSWNSAGGA